MVREYTKSLLDLVESGGIDKEAVILMCLNYMSEDDVKDMMQANDLDIEYQEEDEDEDDSAGDDGQPDEAQEWHDFDPDC